VLSIGWLGLALSIEQRACVHRAHLYAALIWKGAGLVGSTKVGSIPTRWLSSGEKGVEVQFLGDVCNEPDMVVANSGETKARLARSL
jgi:hypothetical protein